MYRSNPIPFTLQGLLDLATIDLILLQSPPHGRTQLDIGNKRLLWLLQLLSQVGLRRPLHRPHSRNKLAAGMIHDMMHRETMRLSSDLRPAIMLGLRKGSGALLVTLLI
jgi:hypothetical protein